MENQIFLNKEKKQLKWLNISLVCLLFLTVSGCAEFDMPTPGTILQQPLGTTAVKVGMTKNNVISLWGTPTHIEKNKFDAASGRTREVWTYSAKYSAIPVDAGYLSKTKYIYFDGNNVTKVLN